MTMTITQQIITVAVVVLGTMTTRFLPFIIFPEGKEPPTTGCDYLSGESIALCSDWIAGSVLLKRCAGKYSLWIAGIDCHSVYCGVT